MRGGGGERYVGGEIRRKITVASAASYRVASGRRAVALLSRVRERASERASERRTSRLREPVCGPVSPGRVGRAGRESGDSPLRTSRATFEWSAGCYPVSPVSGPLRRPPSSHDPPRTMRARQWWHPVNPPIQNAIKRSPPRFYISERMKV